MSSLNSGKRWTAYGHSRLIQLTVLGRSNREIAAVLLRSSSAVACKKHKMKRRILRTPDFKSLMTLCATNYGMIRVGF